MPPTDFTDLHRTACWGCSPTEYAEFTELLAEDVLPQIAQIYTETLAEWSLLQIARNSQKLLLSVFSHRLHRSTQMVRLRKIVAEVSLPPQQLLSRVSHRIRGIHRTFLLRRASHRLHRLSQMLLTMHPNFCEIRGFCGRTYAP